MASQAEQLKHRGSTQQAAAREAASDRKKLQQRHSLEEVARHTTPGDMWIIHNHFVFDIPERWLEKHPGGYDAIAEFAGKDATDAFEIASNIGHSQYARSQIAKLCIGVVEGEDPSEDPGESPADRSPDSGFPVHYAIFALLAIALLVKLLA